MANNIKKIREKKGISILKLSKMTGLSRVTIYNAENAEESTYGYGTSSRTFEKIAKALGVKLSDIFL